MRQSDAPQHTVKGIETAAQGRAAIWARRGFLLALLAFVLCGATGLLGVRTATTSTEEDGWSVAVEHAATARAGLDAPWKVTVTHPGGFEKDLTLAVTADYFDIFETQGFEPEPSDETRDGDTLYLTFATPPGDTFVLSYDAYLQPSAQTGRDGTVAVLVDGDRVATTDFRTRLLP